MTANQCRGRGGEIFQAVTLVKKVGTGLILGLAWHAIHQTMDHLELFVYFYLIYTDRVHNTSNLDVTHLSIYPTCRS